MARWRLLLAIIVIGDIDGWVLYSCSPVPSRPLIQRLVKARYSEDLPAASVGLTDIPWEGASEIEFTQLEVVQVGSRQKVPSRPAVPTGPFESTFRGLAVRSDLGSLAPI